MNKIITSIILFAVLVACIAPCFANAETAQISDVAKEALESGNSFIMVEVDDVIYLFVRNSEDNEYIALIWNSEMEIGTDMNVISSKLPVKNIMDLTNEIYNFFEI